MTQTKACCSLWLPLQKHPVSTARRRNHHCGLSINLHYLWKMNFSNFFSPVLTRASNIATNHQLFQQRFMSKYLSKAAAKRLPLNTKRAGKGYYKGKGGTKEGKLNSKGKFIVDMKKRLELIVPDLEGFKVSQC
jgi:hypothetical protein